MEGIIEEEEEEEEDEEGGGSVNKRKKEDDTEVGNFLTVFSSCVCTMLPCKSSHQWLSKSF